VGLLAPPQLLILRGDWARKTTLVKALRRLMRRADEVTSPTFTLLHEYDGAREGIR